jgi:hypothetical protein
VKIFVIPSWYPSLSNPIYGTFVKEQIELMAKANDQSEFGISLDLVYLCRLKEDTPDFRLSREVTRATFYAWNQLPVERMYRQHADLIHLLARQHAAWQVPPRT